MIAYLRKKVFYGWWVLLACAAIQFYFGGTFYQGFTALFNPIAEEFNWSYAVVSFAFTFRGFESGILAPIVGFFADRIGARKLLLSGVIITSVGFVLFSQVQALWSFYSTFMMLALGLSLTSGVVSMAAVSTWFGNHKRSTLAMGLLAVGFGASGLLVPAVVWLVDLTGWRDASVVFAIAGAVICIPLALLVKEPPGHVLAGAKQVGQTGKIKSRQTGEIYEVIKSRQFWLISVAILLAAVANMAVMVHQIPHMTDVGISRSVAGFMVVVHSLGSTAGRLLFGWLGDKYDKRYCFVVAAVMAGLGTVGFALAVTPLQFAVSMVVHGLGAGGVIPLRPALQTQAFGIRNFGTIQGLLMTAVTVGSIVTPPLAGRMFDVSGSYVAAFVGLGAVTMLAIPPVLMVRKGGQGTPTG